jgi:hypothetical protein
MFGFIKNFFKSMKPSEYKIKQYPLENDGYVYVAFYNNVGSWWSIRVDGTTSISEQSVSVTGKSGNFNSMEKEPTNIYLTSIEKAGEVVNKHSTNGGSKVVWMG